MRMFMDGMGVEVEVIVSVAPDLAGLDGGSVGWRSSALEELVGAAFVEELGDSSPSSSVDVREATP